MAKNPEVYLVCATIRGPGSAEAVCSKCSTTIWPTRGSLARALAEGLPLICVDCYAKIDEIEFGGFMHHGTMLPEALAEPLFLEFEQRLQQEKALMRLCSMVRARRRDGKIAV